jgi:hypothetical protein
MPNEKPRGAADTDAAEEKLCPESSVSRRTPQAPARQAAERSENGLLEAALDYYARGWCVLPVKGRQPTCRWKRCQAKRPDRRTLDRWFQQNGLTGLGVLAGEVSGGLVCRDFDKPGSYERWAAEHPELAGTLPTVKTGRGYHVYFVGAVRRIVKLDDGELRGKGLSVLPPSRHPSGAVYKWVVPLPNGPLPTIDPFLSGLVPSETERQRNGVNRETEAIGAGALALAILDDCTELNDVEQAIEHAIASTLPANVGQRNEQVFDFARTLKAIPALASAPASALRDIVKLWHKRALPVIGTKPFDETWDEFTQGWPNVKWPKGTNLMTLILKRADASALPAVAGHYECPYTHRLIKLCRELQRASGASPFFLACRTAGQLLGMHHERAWRRLGMLVADGILSVAERGTKTRATRYRYVAEDGEKK